MTLRTAVRILAKSVLLTSSWFVVYLIATLLLEGNVRYAADPFNLLELPLAVLAALYATYLMAQEWKK